MARQAIDISTVQPNGKRGEPAKGAFEKINNMTDEIYTSLSGLIPTASHIDMTANRLLRTGDFGIGGPAQVFEGNMDALDIVPVGRCYISNTTQGVKPPGVNYGTLDTLKAQVGDQVVCDQFLHEVTGGNGASLRTFKRSNFNYGSWSPWVQITTTTDFEAGSNSNGSYLKLPDGTLMCRGNFQMPQQAISSQSTVTATLPYNMSSSSYGLTWSPINSIGSGSQEGNGALQANGMFYSKNTNNIIFQSYSYRYALNVIVSCEYVAFGRWK